MTTCHKSGIEEFGHRWLEGRENWPKGTEFHWYTEGYPQPEGTVGKDFADMPEFAAWKKRHAAYQPHDWRWDVVKYAHKVFAAADALADFDGIGVWLDADCVTYKKVPRRLIEKAVETAYMAHYGRTGMYTETGMWIVNCAHPCHKDFLRTWQDIYLNDEFKQFPQWHDCMTLDATIRAYAKAGVEFNNLSGEFHKDMHPQAKSEFGKYCDHTKGPRKVKGFSPENKFRHAAS